MLLLGGSAVINAITGMDIYAAAFLIPIGVILCAFSQYLQLHVWMHDASMTSGGHSLELLIKPSRFSCHMIGILPAVW